MWLISAPRRSSPRGMVSRSAVSGRMGRQSCRQPRPPQVASRKPVGLDYSISPRQAARWGDHRRVIFPVVYLLARCLLRCLMVRGRREVSKDAELLVLRHENAWLIPSGQRSGSGSSPTNAPRTRQDVSRQYHQA